MAHVAQPNAGRCAPGKASERGAVAHVAQANAGRCAPGKASERGAVAHVAQPNAGRCAPVKASERGAVAHVAQPNAGRCAPVKASERGAVAHVAQPNAGRCALANIESVTQRGDGCFQCSVFSYRRLLRSTSNQDRSSSVRMASFPCARIRSSGGLCSFRLGGSLALAEPRCLVGRTEFSGRSGCSRRAKPRSLRSAAIEAFVIRPFPSFFGVGLQDEPRLREGAICRWLPLIETLYRIILCGLYGSMVDAGCGSTIGVTKGLGNKAFRGLRSSVRRGESFSFVTVSNIQ